MADRTLKTGEAFVDIVPVFDFDQVSRVSGQTSDDFGVTIYKDGVNVTEDVSLSIAEIEDSGNYLFSVDAGFPDVGFYTLDIQVLYNESWWRIDIETHLHDIDDVYLIIVEDAGVEMVTLTVVDSSLDDTPIADALVNVLGSDDTTFITYGRTNADGVVVFSLNSGTYHVRMYSPGYAFDIETLIVPEGGLTQTLEGSSISVAAPADPSVCRLYAYFYSMDGTAFSGFKVKVSNLYNPGADAGMAIVEGEHTATSDSNGLVQIDVVQGTTIKVAFIGTKLTRTITVPAEPTASLLTLMGQNTDAFRIVRAS